MLLQILDSVHYTSSFSYVMFRRMVYMLNIPLSFRTIFSIYQSYENNTSEIYSDRAVQYASFVFFPSGKSI